MIQHALAFRNILKFLIKIARIVHINVRHAFYIQIVHYVRDFIEYHLAQIPHACIYYQLKY